MQLRSNIDLARRWWWVFIIAILVAAAPAYILTDLQPRTYRATVIIFVNQSTSPGTVTYSDALLSLQLVQTYSRMAQQPVVLEQVIERLDLPYSIDTFGDMVSSTPLRDTQLFQISVTAQQPDAAAAMANAVADVFIEQQRTQTSGADALRVAQPARAPTTPVAPSPMRNAVLAGLLGLMIAGGIVWFMTYLDDTVKTSTALSTAGVPLPLGMLTHRRRSREEPTTRPAALTAPRGQTAESFRVIRTNLEFASIDRPLRSLLVTSASPHEGKTSLAADLAVVIAQANRQVILVDADLRRPNLHRAFEVPNTVGLTSLLLDDIDLDAACIQTEVPGLLVLPTGPLPPNPADVLASPRFVRVLERLTQMADVVILDSPPVLAVADPIVLAGRVDGTLIVVDARRTRVGTLRQAVAALQHTGTWIVGGVLNRVPPASRSYAYDQHGYYDDGDESPSLAPRRVRRSVASRD